MLFLSTALIAEDRISLMTYNVENMFDTSHDEGKDDYTYLPQSLKKGALKDQVKKSCGALKAPVWRKECLELDWNDELLGIKMQQIGSVVRQIQTSRGNGPDILFMQEVENFNVFKQFVESQTPDAGYYGVLLEASDPRGIDSAFLSRFPISQKRAPQLHPIITESGSQLARGVLEVTVDLPDGTPLTALVFHFPAAYHPTDKREAALRTLNQIRETIPSNHIVVGGGDSNITDKEENKNGILRSITRPFWTLIEDFCQGCAGTEYYEKDRAVLISESLFELTHADNELAYILAHGLVHAINGHKHRQVVDKTHQFEDVVMYGVITTALMPRYKPAPFDREIEQQADREAQNMMSAAGYSSQGRQQIINKLNQYSDEKINLWSSIHTK